MKRTLVVLLLAATGCGAHYAFVPVSPPAHVVPAFNRDAAYYAIPEQDPHGDLRVLSYGLEKLTEGDPDAPALGDSDIQTLHLRVIVENTGSKPWSFDTRAQQIVVDGFGAESPAFAVSDRAGDGSMPPVVNLGFGWTRIIDLFYPVPSGAGAMPAFRAVTEVQTDEGAAAETTAFERLEVGVFSPYMQPDVVAEGDYDYLDEPFWTNAGGVAFGGARHPFRGNIYSHGHGIGGSSSSGSSSHTRLHGGGGRGRGTVRRGGGGGGRGGGSSGGGRHR
ncbi:MAG TPA: hypothetical protein VGH28_02670 [Polyangiaceae bacterium]|jgi:hypothetical protein